ncbi:hypothetical protein HPGCJGGD_1877 [Methylobacterium haplocladii]|nr:hypothetical protein HPGCJGGD_1877 [Methylobacterium haplocladii]
MVWIAFVAFGSVAATAGVVIFAKQSLIDDAQAATKGYF